MTIHIIRCIVLVVVPKLEFYQKENGECLAIEYLRSQPKSVRGLTGWLLERLEKEGHELERPTVGYLEDGIYELRVIVDRQHHRLLFFFHGDTVVVTHGFTKKTGEVPPIEIKRAKEARADWLRRGEE